MVTLGLYGCARPTGFAGPEPADGGSGFIIDVDRFRVGGEVEAGVVPMTVETAVVTGDDADDDGVEDGDETIIGERERAKGQVSGFAAVSGMSATTTETVRIGPEPEVRLAD